MRNTHIAGCWTLTPAICRSAYDTGAEVCTVTKVDQGRDADGYHVMETSGRGTAYYISYWEDDHTWRSQKLQGPTPSMWLQNPSKTLKGMLDTLHLIEKIATLESRVAGSAF